MSLIVGNQEQKNNLKKIIESQTIGHAYMFIGIDGIGKSKFACEFAKSILCENATNTYCGLCESCQIFENSPDFVFISDVEDVIKVGDIRSLSENINLKPVKETYVFKPYLLAILSGNSLLTLVENTHPFSGNLFWLFNCEQM